MRGIVIAKMLVLMLWGLYLAIGLTHGAGSDERRASGSTLSSQHATLSSRHLLPGSTFQPALECADGWIPVTSTGMTAGCKR